MCWTKLRRLKFWEWRWIKQLKLSDKISLCSAISQVIVVLIMLYSVSSTIELSNKSIDLSNKSIDLSKQALCLQKDADYRDIAPPTITVFLKDPPDTNTPIGNRTTLIFIFHIIPNSKTFFYPDASVDITNTNGFSDEITMTNPFSLCSPCDFYIERHGGLNFVAAPNLTIPSYSIVWLPYDYRNERFFYKIYDISITRDANSNISFSHPPDTFANVNFSFKIKDAYGNKYNSTVLYNISILSTNIESIRQTKVFEFQRPNNYSC